MLERFEEHCDEVVTVVHHGQRPQGDDAQFVHASTAAARRRAFSVVGHDRRGDRDVDAATAHRGGPLVIGLVDDPPTDEPLVEIEDAETRHFVSEFGEQSIGRALEGATVDDGRDPHDDVASLLEDLAYAVHAQYRIDGNERIGRSDDDARRLM